jgi:hypothetical protein
MDPDKPSVKDSPSGARQSDPIAAGPALPLDDADHVVLRADIAAVRMGSAAEVLGAADVAATFSGRARTAQPALVNGAAGAVWAPGGLPRVVFAFTIAGGTIVQIEMIADPARLSELDLSILER